MSATVWSSAKGWHDGPEVKVSNVASLNNRNDLQFVSDSQDTAAIRFDFGPQWDGFEYDSYFVRIEDGEYAEIWGMCGIIPRLDKMVTRLV